MKIVERHKKTDFGDVWYVNAIDGTYRFAIYKYDDDKDTIYLSNVFVKEESRRQGYGNEILNAAEDYARKMDASVICLKVLSGSDVHRWYKRHGYVDLEKDEEERGYMWMRKDMKDLNESLWADVQSQASGEVDKKEDDVNHLDFYDFYEYLTGRYTNRKSINGKDYIVKVDDSKFISLITFEDTKDSRFYRVGICDFDKKPYITIPKREFLIRSNYFKKISEAFELTELEALDTFDTPKYIVKPKDGGEVNNRFFITVIDFLIDNVEPPYVASIEREDGVRESLWADVQSQASGEVIKKEDDVNKLDIPAFKEYLQNRYVDKDHTGIYSKHFVYTTDDLNDVYVFFARPHANGTSYVLWFNSEDDIITFGTGLPVECPDIYNKLVDAYEVEYTNIGKGKFYVIEPGKKATNKLFVEILDFAIDSGAKEVILKRIEDTSVDESLWADVQSQASGDVIKKEDDLSRIDNYTRDELVEFLQERYSPIPPRPKTYHFVVDFRQVVFNLLAFHYMERVKGYMGEYRTYPVCLEGIDDNDLRIVIRAYYETDVPEMYDALCENFKLQAFGRKGQLSGDSIKITPKDGSPVTFSFYVKVIDFLLERVKYPFQKVIDFASSITESLWADVQNQASGTTLKKEDDVANMGIDKFVDYLISRYWKPKQKIYYIDRDKYSQDYEEDIVVDPVNEVVIYGSYNKGELQRIKIVLQKGGDHLISKCPKHLVWHRMEFNRYVITERNKETTNQTYVDLIDFILKYYRVKVDESLWAEIQNQASGDTLKEEDSVLSDKIIKKLVHTYPDGYANDHVFFEKYKDGLDGFIEHIKSFDDYHKEHNLKIDKETFNYPAMKKYIIKNWTEGVNFSKIIEDKVNEKKDLMESTGFKKEPGKTAYQTLSDWFASLDTEMKKRVIIDCNKFEKILYIGDNVAEMKDAELEELFDGTKWETSFKVYVKYHQKANESLWADVQNQASGESEKKEEEVLTDDDLKQLDQDMNESLWADVQGQAAGTTVKKEDDVNNMSMQRFVTYLKKNYKILIDHPNARISYASKQHELAIPIYDHSSVEGLIQVSYLHFNDFEDVLYIHKRITRDAPELAKKLRERFDVWDDDPDYDMWFIIHPADTNKYPDNAHIIDVLDFILDNLDDSVIPIIAKKDMNESVWADVQGQASGEQIKKEDEMSQQDLECLDQYIMHFANEVVYGQGRGEEAGNLDEFCDYIRTDNEVKDADKDKILNYVKEVWFDELCDEVSGAIEQVQKEYHQDMYESVWADVQGQASGEQIKKEDDKLDERENMILNQTAKMFKHNMTYADDEEDDYYYSDTKEDFIMYIEQRKGEQFWAGVEDDTYDKLIAYVNKKWDDKCKGIDDFTSEYIYECEGVPGGLTPADVGGMGAAYFPGLNGEPGSGDLPMPTGHVYQQVAPFAAFIKERKKKGKKKKKFRKEDEPCVHSPNAKVYDYVDDYREYVDRTYDMVNKRK